MLCEESDKNIVSRQSETNVNSVHHIHIHNANAMKQFVGHFPNVTELTLSENCDVFRDCTTTNFNRIIPLKQITKLAIDCHRFSFQRLMKLLSLTPNVHTLKLSSILLYETDALIIQQNEIFQMISTTNIVANVAVTKEITEQKIELIFGLFPRLEYLEINLDKEDLKSIGQFLLSTSNTNTRYLSSLCLLHARRDLMEQLKNLIESEKLLHDYTIKLIDYKLYLWW
jgi:hypothetical protein